MGIPGTLATNIPRSFAVFKSTLFDPAQRKRIAFTPYSYKIRMTSPLQSSFTKIQTASWPSAIEALRGDKVEGSYVKVTLGGFFTASNELRS